METPPDDPIGAFCTANHVALPAAGSGALNGLSFAAKDLFDIAGSRTGFGQPDWLRTHAPAAATAPAVQRCLEAGARLVGRTHCDELCYSLTGENVHYGTPVNVKAPGRIPGGSSNGSAAAVAAGLVDFALGSDCGGSVRIPASYCGVLGLRTTWGRVPLEGAAPFGPSFDVVGHFAVDADVFLRVGRVLLDDQRSPRVPRRILMARDAFARLAPDVAAALAPAVARVGGLAAQTGEVVVSEEGLEAWFETFRVIQAAEIWASLGAWVRQTQPSLGPGVKERLAWAQSVTPQMLHSAQQAREAVRARLAAVLADDEMLCLPTSPRVAPARGMPVDQIEVEFRQQAMCLLCISGLTGLPQVSMPAATLDGLPLGLSLIGPRGSDVDLMHMAALAVGTNRPEA
ncbi:MAG: amidase [Hyphomicrobiaceae bacterium]|nr:amidase [Hyphomicrobiaceae bacterium]